MNQIASEQIERESYEAFVLTQQGGNKTLVRRRDFPGAFTGEYVLGLIEFGWVAWKARSAASTQTEPLHD